jgi:hypothetical protein
MCKDRHSGRSKKSWTKQQIRTATKTPPNQKQKQKQACKQTDKQKLLKKWVNKEQAFRKWGQEKPVRHLDSACILKCWGTFALHEMKKNNRWFPPQRVLCLFLLGSKITTTRSHWI